MAERENRHDGEQSQSGRDGYKSYNREGYNRNNRYEGGNYGRRPYNNNHEGGERPYRSFNSRNNNGEDRPQRSYGSRPQRPYNNNGSRPQRSYNPNFNRNEEGGERSYNSRSYNNNGGRPQRPYTPRFNNNDEEGGRRPYRSFNNNGDRPQRPYTPRYNNNDDEGGQRPYRSFNNNNGQRGSYGRPQGGNFRPRTADYNPNAKYSAKKQIEYKEVLADPNEPIRLNKFLANAGICSRREADEFIAAGVVSVNGEIVTELGTKIKRTDEVKFHDQSVNIERKVYVLLNKPKDCVTTSDDPQERKTVMDFVKDACKERIYPVGRLDRNTTGVLLLTNDGDLASKLTHPKYLKKKVYHVYCDKNVTKADLDQIAAGVTLDDGDIHADSISYASETDRSQVGIEIHSGKNRIVRRIFESLGYRVIKLDRVYFAGLTKKGLRRGDWRYLTEMEVNMLRMGSFE